MPRNAEVVNTISRRKEVIRLMIARVEAQGNEIAIEAQAVEH